jgi:tetratricopeptide (TPR) repeat protein
MELLQQARSLYEKGEMHDALEVAQVACERKPKDAEAWWLLGCISRYTGMPAASDAAFKRAAELSPKRPAPARVSTASFRAMIDRALAELSPDARRRLARTRVEVEPLPGLDLVRAGVSPDAPTDRQRQPVDVLILFQVNLENRAGSEARLASLIAKTLARA